MAYTNPDNVFSPDKSRVYTLTSDLEQMAESVQDALTKRANFYTGTSQERRGISDLPAGSHWQDTDGEQFEWVFRGGKWWGVSRVLSGGLVVSSPSPNTPTSTWVSFPEGFFTSNPHVVASSRTSVPGSTVVEVSTLDASPSGFSVYIYRTNSTDTGVDWIATQSPEYD